MKRISYVAGLFSFLAVQVLTAQEVASGIVNEEASKNVVKTADTTQVTTRIKVDGVAAVIGDYVILESDVDKILIDIRSQGGKAEDVTKCQLLGKLMEDKLYAHHAVQDSIEVSDTEIQNVVSYKIEQFVAQVGSMEKLLQFYNKDSEESFREELFEIEKGRELSDRMRSKILEEIEITPEEVRQWFNKIPKDELPVFGAEMELAQIVKLPKASKEEIDRVVNRLKEMKRDVEENGASFATKAILNSKDEGSRAKGGFYSINKKTNFVKEFKDVAYSLEEGQVSDPFETDFGWHILMVEKIRGQELDVRHILLKPEVSDKAMDEAKEELNLIRKRIMDKEMTFEEAAKEFSDQKETKFDGGVLRNPTNFDTRFELNKIDPILYNQVRDLKGNEISLPVIQEGDTGNIAGYKILRVTDRHDEHPADFSKDYLKIQELALRDKQRKVIEEWTVKKIKDTYINVSPDNRSCNFALNWLKK
ncbi:peptidylprolyl isomerase [Leptobacterium flavescens]|nr:peptidylprolyl isomerase [Leptobacterium flavescens]